MPKRKSTGGTLNDAPAMPKHYEERERTYRARDALRTLTEADTIRRDRDLMRDVKTEAKKVIRTVEGTKRPRAK